MSIEVEVQVNEQGQLQIPEEIQRQLFPGMTVVLRLETGANGSQSAEKEPLDISGAESTQAGLILKEGLLVYRGEVPEGFDWDTFLQENREAPLHPYEPDQE